METNAPKYILNEEEKKRFLCYAIRIFPNFDEAQIKRYSFLLTQTASVKVADVDGTSDGIVKNATNATKWAISRANVKRMPIDAIDAMVSPASLPN